MQKGLVLKGYSGFYYVQAGNSVVECKLRGKLKLSHTIVLAGDEVKFESIGDKGVINEILPRKTALIRPPIANVDQALVIFSLKNPDPVPELLDRILIAVEYAGIKPVIIFTKADLFEDAEIVQTYRNVGYPVIVTSVVDKRGIDDLRKIVSNKISVAAGPSGAGKSSLLNLLKPGLKLKTGNVSEKIGRGKHTTRHVELIPLDETGYIADTPGFSVLYLPDMEPQKLADFYPEFLPLSVKCRFSGCLHKAEPACAVRQAAEEGKISKGRYERYCVFLDQLIDKEKRSYD